MKFNFGVAYPAADIKTSCEYLYAEGSGADGCTACASPAKSNLYA